MRAQCKSSLAACLAFLLVCCCQHTDGVLLRYGADDAVLNDSRMKSDNNGHTGSGYVDFNGAGSYAEWVVQIPESGEYVATVRYTTPTDRPADVIVDNSLAPLARFDFASTGGWKSWETEPIVLYLRKGSRRLKVLASRNPGPNVNWLEISSKTEDKIVVLESNDFLSPGQFVSSPSGEFKFGLGQSGELALKDAAENTIWSAGSIGGSVLYMQDDGNLVVRDQDRNVVFSTSTGERHGSHLVVTDHGTATLVHNGVSIWTTQFDPAPVPAPSSEVGEDALALGPDDFLGRNQYISSPSGRFRVGLTANGEFVLQDHESITVWSAGINNAALCYMQSDGNLVVRGSNQDVLFATSTASNSGAHLLISDGGYISVTMDSTLLWTSTPQQIPSPVGPPSRNPQLFAKVNVLHSGSLLERGEFVSSPSGEYQVGLTNSGDLVVEDWHSRRLWTAGIVDGYRCFMQPDGNLIVRDNGNSFLWSTQTDQNDGARFVLDDGGLISVMHGSTVLWSAGLSRGNFYEPPGERDEIEFPTRGIFYYPWYPTTWEVNGATVRFEPDLGFYSSSNPVVVEEHIDALEYAYVDLSIASWWGPDTNSDRARLNLLMDETVSLQSSIKWTVYYEDEQWRNPTRQVLREALDYLKEWFAWHPAWAYRNNRPVIFVYNEAGCEVVERWMDASDGNWFVVLKVFKGYRDCERQPDSWHQYGPAEATLEIDPYSYTISPGFWKADVELPLLDRVSEDDFCDMAKSMVESGQPWQLVTTFNEAGEGTMIEASQAWKSSSGYGFYLDCLHLHH